MSNNFELNGQNGLLFTLKSANLWGVIIAIAFILSSIGSLCYIISEKFITFSFVIKDNASHSIYLTISFILLFCAICAIFTKIVVLKLGARRRTYHQIKGSAFSVAGFNAAWVLIVAGFVKLSMMFFEYVFGLYPTSSIGLLTVFAAVAAFGIWLFFLIATRLSRI